MDPQAAQSLRAVVHDCLAKHMYEAAAFFADKLVTLSGYAPAEVYTLAQAFFCSRQFRRCLHLLRGTELIEKDLRFRYLAARCLAECREWEDCLTVLGGLDVEEPEQLALPLPRPAAPPGTAGINYFSVVCLLRGRVYDALENAPRAVKWYRAALQADPFNYEAFQALVGGHKLSNGEELELVRGLDIPAQHGWLKLLYTSRCKMYEQGGSIEGTLATLEAEPAAGSQQQQQQQQAGAGADAGGAMQPAAAQQQQQQQAGGGGSGSMQTPGKGAAAAAAAASGPQPMALSPLQAGASSAAGGWGLSDNLDVIACRADWLYHRGAYAECYALTAAALERDPYAASCLPVHLASALELRKKNELFLRGHKWAGLVDVSL